MKFYYNIPRYHTLYYRPAHYAERDLSSNTDLTEVLAEHRRWNEEVVIENGQEWGGQGEDWGHQECWWNRTSDWGIKGKLGFSNHF